MAVITKRRTEITIETDRLLIMRLPEDSTADPPVDSREPEGTRPCGEALAQPGQHPVSYGLTKDGHSLAGAEDFPALDVVLASPSPGWMPLNPGKSANPRSSKSNSFHRVIDMGLAAAPELRLFVLSVWCAGSSGLLPARNFIESNAIALLALALVAMESAALVRAAIKSTKPY